jgi:hypothetical protein
MLKHMCLKVRALGALAVVSVAAWNVSAGVSRAGDVVRVEEDWTLVIGQPDGNLNAPQVATGMSPLGNFNSAYVVFNVNHRSQPTYVPGGLQLQLWTSDDPLLSDDDPHDEVMTTSGEKVTWTQQMTLQNGVLTVAIVNGTSQTWGAFGGGSALQASVAASFTNLNGYSPNTSIANSGVSFAPNRVQSLTLTAVRYYTSDGQVIVDNQVRVAFPDSN